ncbi:MAG: DUF6503 family protein [Bacteroidota bacterium]
MKAYLFAIFFLIFCSCKQNSTQDRLTAQQIVDKSIAISGGSNYLTHDVSYTFRDRYYESKNIDGKKVLKRITETDSVTITDIKQGNDFQRFFDGDLIALSDTTASKYANSVNSVHYFSRLPFGLNDGAVTKELLGVVQLNEEEFYKVKVTFEQENGGMDFEDTYLYWFQKKDFKPKYLAYEYHTDGGGIRFREAYNERYVNGIRFVDYNNLKPLKGHEINFFKVDSLFMANQLELLSKIELEEIKVTPSSD